MTVYLIEQQTLVESDRDERWALRRRLAGRLLDRSRGVTRRERHLLRQRFIAAWAWVVEEDAVDTVERAILRGGLDRQTVAGLRDGAQDHLGFFLDLLSRPLPVGAGTLPAPSGTREQAAPSGTRGQPTPAGTRGEAAPTGTREQAESAPAPPRAHRPRRVVATDWPTLFPVGG